MALDALLEQLVALDGSDLYLTVGSPPMVNARGEFRPAGDGQPLGAPDVLALLREALPPSDLAAWERDGDANAAYAIAGSDRFRVNAFRQRGEPGLVVRRIRATIQPLEDLALPVVLARLSLEPRGLILVTGATGSGKSTTIAAMIDYRNSNLPGHIVTLEDPIEFVHPHRMSLVSQREIGFDTPSYAAGLKNALRQAPNVLLVGEIRDSETAEAALHFAETGHLVLATLHSMNANQALKRLLSLFPQGAERGVLHQLSLTLRAVVSQRLVPRADGAGRAVAVEVLLNTPRVADLVKEGRIEEMKEAMLQASVDGAQTFDGHLHDLYRAGAITADTAVAFADSPNDVRLKIRLEGGAHAPATTIKIAR